MATAEIYAAVVVEKAAERDAAAVEGTTEIDAAAVVETAEMDAAAVAAAVAPLSKQAKRDHCHGGTQFLRHSTRGHLLQKESRNDEARLKNEL